jgi:cation diffusion facilitator CzcD-associated flavoprotein CzcO
MEIAVIGDAKAAEFFGVDAAVTEVVAAVFDDTTDSWLLRTGDRQQYCARVVVDAERMLYQPNIPKANTFRGLSFHSANWDAAFEPTGQRVAVIGERAAHVVAALTGSKVTLFDCPPNWQTRTTKRRRLFRKQSAAVVTAPIRAITPSGIRTADGAEHPVDAIIYATGCTGASGMPDDTLVGSDGTTIQHAWRDAATAYLGVAVHGFPNYFMLQGPDSPVGDAKTVIDVQTRYIGECLNLMQHQGSTRIEVRFSAEQQFTQRARAKSPRLAFDLIRTDREHEIYDGPATLTIGADNHRAQVRLTGHVNPIDGKYHWQGTIFGATADLSASPRLVTISTDAARARARITEQTPWGSYSIAGVGAPPYELT